MAGNLLVSEPFPLLFAFQRSHFLFKRSRFGLAGHMENQPHGNEAPKAHAEVPENATEVVTISAELGKTKPLEDMRVGT